ncbi:MAG: winged helix-turn-helix domain-containing protein [Phycisphaerae bacterium]
MHAENPLPTPGPLNITRDPIPCSALVVNDAEVPATSVVATIKAEAAHLDHGTDPADEVIVLDVTPTEEEGAELIRQIQESGQMPIIVLSSGKRTETLKLSADTDTASPSKTRLRVVRCRMLGAAPAQANPSLFQCGDLRVDLLRRFVTLRGEPVRLSKNEFRLLAAFVRNAGKTLTGRQLLEESFGPDTTKTEHYLRMYIMLLRRRIERNAGKPRYILTDRNRGYRLASPAQIGFAMKRPA